ncbi:MAG: glycoside hydrolase family 5 protein [Litorimonas sp.]
MRVFKTSLTALILLLASIQLSSAQEATLTPVAKHGQLSVVGPHILDKNGEITSLAGPSFFWSNTGWGQERFYTKGAVETFAKDWNAGIIRVAMGAQGNGSYLEDENGNLDRVVTAVNAAIKNGLYVIIDWHSHHAEQDVEEAKLFFTAIAEAYGEYPNVIYEIYNEPLNTTDWSTVVRPYAEELIDTIRKVDPDNLIIVGTQSWDQDVDKAADDPITDRTNILYALHFYAASHKADLRKKAEYAIDKGLPLILSEWGSVTYNGDGTFDKKSTLEWMKFARKHSLSHLNWSVSDKAETASMFRPSASSDGGWTEKDLTPSGKLVREIIRDW